MPDKSAQRQRPMAPRTKSASSARSNSIPATVQPKMEEGQILKSGQACEPTEWDKGTSSPQD